MKFPSVLLSIPPIIYITCLIINHVAVFESLSIQSCFSIAKNLFNFGKKCNNRNNTKKKYLEISETKRIYWKCFYHFITNSLEMEKDIQRRDAPRVVDIEIRQREK